MSRRRTGATEFFVEFIGHGLVEAVRLLLRLEPEVYFIAWTSMYVSLTALVVSALAGLPLVLLLATRRFPGRRLLILGFNTALSLPTVVVGLVVYGMLSRLGPLGFLGMLFTPGAMIVAQAILAFPIVVALGVSALAGLDARIRPTARSLGASRSQEIWTLLKEARWGLLAAFSTAFGRILTEVGAAIMVGGNIAGSTRTLTTAITLETARGNFALGIALGIILLTAALAVNLAVTLLTGRRHVQPVV